MLILNRLKMVSLHFRKMLRGIVRIYSFPTEKKAFLNTIAEIKAKKLEQNPVSWQVNIIQNPSMRPDEEIFRIIEKYWDHYNATSNFQDTPDDKKTLEVTFENVDIFNAALEYIFKAMNQKINEIGI